MKPPPFDYLRASNLEEVWDALDRDEDVKLIAGGQSLVPLMNLRLASPSLLVDITRLKALQGVTSQSSVLRIGALTRHAEIERHPLVVDQAPLLSQAASWVAHAQIRNRGTLGGSVAHSDSAAELPAALLALDATMVARSRGGERRIPAREFFGSYFTTALVPGELLTAVELPVALPSATWGFAEFARRRGDYAIGGAAVYADRGPDQVCRVVRAGLLAAGPAPCLAPGLGESMVGRVVDAGLISRTVESTLAQLSPGENVHGTVEYRRDIIGEMLRRALASAFQLGEVA
ncbi:FAD binding domain-containing protein [Rhodococcus qingshengii]|uniref:FAD-binding PCMH-type domain-containing protein n=1 Tax=Rhodococcus qingshengii TaxID=334542 RepID=A0A2A5J2G8_RHOSG|nr:xanthine dehydrogenase family protein subunit M [Rhodococcus qingshengii]PCK23171.1 hypothetical protein CHR55_30845 [Rhodococcus qingshengii]